MRLGQCDGCGDIILPRRFYGQIFPFILGIVMIWTWNARSVSCVFEHLFSSWLWCLRGCGNFRRWIPTGGRVSLEWREGLQRESVGFNLDRDLMHTWDMFDTVLSYHDGLFPLKPWAKRYFPPFSNFGHSGEKNCDLVSVKKFWLSFTFDLGNKEWFARTL